MAATVRACVEHGVGIGAHPSFPDLVGFGRRAIEATDDEVRTDTLYQLGALSAFATAAGTRVEHVTPHGRLANVLVTHEGYAQAMAGAVADVDPSILVLAQEGALTRAAEQRGLTVGYLALADRGYLPDGRLVPRTEDGAVLTDANEVVERTVRMVTEGVVTSVTGADVAVRCDSVLLHGDGPHALAFARRLRTDLERAGVTFAPLRSVVAARTVG